MKDIKVDYKALGKILKSEKMRERLHEVATKGLSVSGEGAIVESDIGPNRARAALVGRASEMDGALDAMRN